MRNVDRPHDDDRDVTVPTGSWTDRQVDALLDGRGEPADADLMALIADLRRFRNAPAPTPSPALQALLDGSAMLPVSAAMPAGYETSRRHHRIRLRATVLVLTASLGLVTAGAAANALPRGAQRTAARILNTLTPFHFPTPPTSPRSPASPTAPHPDTPPPEQASPQPGAASSDPGLDRQSGGHGDGTDGAPGPRSPTAAHDGSGTDSNEVSGSAPVSSSSGASGDDGAVVSQQATTPDTASGSESSPSSSGSTTDSTPTPNPTEGSDAATAGPSNTMDPSETP